MYVTVYSVRMYVVSGFFLFRQNTAYELRMIDWSSDVCSSDLCPLSKTGRRFGLVTFGDRAILYHLYDAVPNLRPVIDSGQCPAINRSPAPDIIGPHPVHIAHEAGDRVSRGKGIPLRKNDSHIGKNR